MRLQIFPSFIAMLAVVAFASATSAVDADVQKAIAKGVKYLQGIHKPGDSYQGGSHNMGTATLAGMALLESGVKDTDPSLQAIIGYVRDRALNETRTYELSLTIMFLDRLGHPGDRPTIQLLGLRLLGGQGKNGGWNYDCGYSLSATEESRLKALFAKESKLVAKVGNPPVNNGQPNAQNPVPDRRIAAEMIPLHPEVARWAKLVNLPGEPKGDFGKGKDGDNSNTQFGAIGVWCARRNGVPCDGAIALMEKRFRTSQDSDGGWSYHYSYGGEGSTAAMTCAGLLGLAMAHGSKVNALKNRPDNPALKGNNKDARQAPPIEDEAILKGLKCLANYISRARGQAVDGPLNTMAKGFKGKGGDQLVHNLYFMWSLERVGMVFGLDTIGKHDWYAWGADALVASQLANGSWGGKGYSGANEELNTCFALLFLNRANVARDLTAMLKGQVRDPGVAVLRGSNEPMAIAVPPREKPMIDPVVVKPIPVPVDPFEENVARLSKALIDATPDTRAERLAELRDAKGSVYTDALACACARLTGDAQREARQTLARRLTRMKAATLREMLRDVDREIHTAAVVACGLKGDRQMIPDLIGMIADADAGTAHDAWQSLRALSGQDFGPKSDASALEKTKAILAWREWWKTQPK